MRAPRLAVGFLWVFPALLLVRQCQACMDTAWSSGYLAPEEEIEAVTVSASQGSCGCCALCHRHASCASLSYNVQSEECKLFSAVATYDRLTPDLTGVWKYFVMPGRSGHHQFCRSDSDCTEGGEFCRGRVCTALSVITCLVIRDVLGAGERFGGFVNYMYGWFNDKPLALGCYMNNGADGATLILKVQKNQLFTEETARNFNTDMSETIPSFSILSLADDLRDLGTESTYQLFLVTHDFRETSVFTLPRNEVVIGSAPRCNVGRIEKASSIPIPVCHLYYSSGETLVSVRPDGDTKWWDGAVVRTAGGTGAWVGKADAIALYIRY